MVEPVRSGVLGRLKDMRVGMRAQLRRSAWVFRIIGVALYVIYPAFLGVIGSGGADIPEAVTDAYGSPWILATIAVFVGFGLLHSFSQLDAPSAAMTVLEVEEDVRRVERDLADQFSDLIFATATAGLGRQLVNLLAAAKGTDGHGQTSESFSNAAKYLFTYLVTEERDEVVYRFDVGERWNFGIYLFCESKNELVCCYRESAPSLFGREMGNERSWPSGEGHIGVAYALKKAQISADVTIAENRDTFLPAVDDARYRETDIEKYRSFASIPILRYSRSADGSRAETQQVGVVYAVSNKPGRFTSEAAVPLHMIADFFAAFLPGEDGALQSLIDQQVQSRTNNKVRGRQPAKRKAPGNGGRA